MSISVLFLILISTSLNAFAQFSLRKAMLVSPPAGALSSFLLGLAVNPFFLAGVACYVTSFLSWTAVLSRLEVSLAYPFASLGFIFAAIFGYYFLGEQLTATRMIGIAMVCGGLVFLTRSA